MTIYKPSKLFGAGQFTGIANVTNPTPTGWDVLQDQSLSVKADLQVLHGTSKWPEDICAGAMTLNGKVVSASLNARQWASHIFGAAIQTNVDRVARNEKGVVNGSNWVKVANAAGFLYNLGVIDPLNGLPLVCVAAGAITQRWQYSVLDGKYTFDASRQGDRFLFSYEYELTNSGASGNMVITNQPMGEPVDFTAVSVLEWKLEQNVWTLNKCVMQDAEIALKQGGHAKPSWSYMAGVDDNDMLGTLSFHQKR